MATEEQQSGRQNGILPRPITTEMRESYLDYAMSVITARALPDVRDGLKPVHRRILFTMQQMGLHAGGKFRKCAAIVGDAMGKYHPHGDIAIYDSLVQMAQDFKYRYPLVIGQGNFGCFTKDTKVQLTDGRALSFEDLIQEAEAGIQNFTYTINDNGLVAIARIKHPRLTRKNAELMSVTLDNGEKIRCTANHLFMTREGLYKEAQHLSGGDSLMPLYQRLSEKSDQLNRQGYLLIQQPKTSEWVPAHHLADNYNLTHKAYQKSAGRVRHHTDFHKRNNNPTNITRLNWEEHWRIHYERAKEQHRDPEYRKKIAEGRKAYWSQSSVRKAYADRLTKRNKENWNDPAYREHMRIFLSEVNKKYIEGHPEKRQELSIRATKTLKNMWKDPAYRSFMHEKIIKGNKNHTSNITGKKKFLAICKEVILCHKDLNGESYETARHVVYPYGAATRWETGLQKYFQNRVTLVTQEIKRNHKVIAVERLTEREDVYDLTIDGTHNFALAAGIFVHNSIDGDPPAAMRYSEAKISRIAEELLRDLEKDTVDWRPNYDATRKEPIVLPSVAPNLLLNGTLGIAVGMATNIPPHNLREVVDATVHLIENKDATTEDLLQFIKGPDFPTGGVLFGEKDLHHAYGSGKGGVVVRGEAEIVENGKEGTQIIISSIPYRVNKADLIGSIADLVRDKKLEGIRGLRDESAKQGMRIAIDVKNTAQPQKVLNFIYKHTQLEDTFHFNMVALGGGVPRTFSLKSMLEEFVAHRVAVVTRRTRFDLTKAQEREHILLGLKKALDHIDAVIKTIRAADDVLAAHTALKKQFEFSDKQADAILEMRLQKLAGLERKKVEDELKEVQGVIKDLQAILGSPAKIRGVIKSELKAVAEKYGDERKTRVMKHGAKTISEEDLIPDEESVLVLSSGGYLKRTNPSEYKRQRRGGVGVIDLSTKEEDFVTMLLTTSTHSDLLFFTDKGKVYQIKMYDVPEGKRATKGKSIMNFLSLEAGEKVTSVLPMPKGPKGAVESLMMVTKHGVVKRSSSASFHDVRRSGLIAIKLGKDDELIAAFFIAKGDNAMLTTRKGQSIRFKAEDVRQMGRGAAGVRGVKLGANDRVVGADVISKELEKPELLVISENGYGKKSKLSEYKVQGRGGSGIKTIKVTPKIGVLIISKVIRGAGEEPELVAISKKGQVIRVGLNEIPTLGRATQGVRIMKLRAGDGIASLTCL